MGESNARRRRGVKRIAQPYVSSEIVKVEPGDRAGWVYVTLRDKDGNDKTILVRKGSAFSQRPPLRAMA